eukprot:CAMPEP_0202447782 /NCGR_PEP_ID=MMETSP1360-20130828/6543_1 /ASSEMBLY_ACC=CAM_ASM_000848 /TAXON_ID=515479 /ORGANISM="Licmophora paradoxa, Strain CCMP2313" /LENGTH=184 /DNA_ID=CAMNT_0049065019 /DNA_START=30 /DNA_END=581 /DNA_ORIENTATION=+
MKVIFSSLLLLFPQSHQAFTLTTTNVKRIASSSSSSSSSLSASTVYGRGAEIWPECNEEPVKLEDSFPNGIIPPAAKQQQLLASSNNNNSEKTKDDESLLQKIDPTPAFITISLLLSGLIRPLDIIIVTALGGYIGILERFARSPRTDGVTPIMPSLPPQGHVPDLVLNPLGKPFTNAIEYEGW